ncbi:MAG: hypothetical protein GX256_08915 [Fretibacterium sp.]|nr:hypothetical protein [Fretibacterium sp.]
MKKSVLWALCICLMLSGATWADTIEPDPELHDLMGGLSALSAVAALKASDPLKDSFLPGGLDWAWAKVSVEDREGDRWVGLEVPASQEVRRFLRLNSPRLDVFEEDGRTPWLSGPRVWMKAGGEEGVVRVGAGDRLFFGTSGTDWLWRSPLQPTESVRRALLKGRDAAPDPALEVVPIQKEAETFKASPVGLPADITVSGDEDNSMEVGGLKVNPIPRMRND